jgi:hypothetical protein
VPKASATQRCARDGVILREFLGGASYRKIGRDPRVNLSAQGVANVVNEALSGGAGRVDLLQEHAATVYCERLERLLSAVWELALAGDCRSVELARRILDQQGRFFRVKDRFNALQPALHNGEESEDQLARFRARFRPLED